MTLDFCKFKRTVHNDIDYMSLNWGLWTLRCLIVRIENEIQKQKE